MKNRVIILIGLLILLTSLFSACANKESGGSSEPSTNGSVQVNEQNEENTKIDHPSDYDESEAYSDGKADNEVPFESPITTPKSEQKTEKTSSTEEGTSSVNNHTEKPTCPTEEITDTAQTDKPLTKPSATDADGWIIGWY